VSVKQESHMSKAIQQEPRRGATPITEDTTTNLAELVLDRLDRPNYRGGRAIEYRESSGGGLVRIHRDDGGRVYFRHPGRSEASVKLSPNRSNCLLSHANRRALEDFLGRNPLVLTFLDGSRIR
jgi:hypothetical protein